MKKKLIIIILVIIISECAAVFSILAYLIKSSSNAKLETFTQKKLSDNTSYNVKAEVELSGTLVNIKEDLVLEEPETRLFVYVPSINVAKTNIIKVSSDCGPSKYSLNDTTLQIDLKYKSQNIHIEYEIDLEKKSETLSYSDSQIYLTNFLLTPFVYRNNQAVATYTYPFGDPYIYNINNYYILFKTRKDMQVAAPGKKEEYLFGAIKFSIFEASNLRDFPAVLYNNADVYEEKSGNTNIIYINSKATKGNVNTAFDFAVKNIGPYPYDSFFVVKAPLNQSGMEFSNMIFLSDSCFKDNNDLKRVTYHEVFHQWFYGIIGTDQLNEPFFDEGMVNYLAMFLCNDRFPSTYNNEFMRLKLKDYTSRSEYYDLAYNNSAVYFNTIHNKLGNDFYKLLQEIYKEKKYKIAYFNDFLKYFTEFSRGK
jgi:hypothetical protein